MVPDEIKVLVQVPCERCEGSGRVGWDTPTPGGFAADQTKPCPDCSERGHIEAAVALPELKRLLELP
jgi:DnaJ-class molecular chaperone